MAVNFPGLNNKNRREIRRDLEGTKALNLIARVSLIIINLVLLISYLISYIYWLAVLEEFKNFLNLSLNKIFKQKIIKSQNFDLKLKITLEILSIVLITVLATIITTLILRDSIPTSNVQIILALGLLNLGLKIFIQIRESSKGFTAKILQDNFLWLTLVIAHILMSIFTRIDVYLTYILGIYIMVQGFRSINQSINAFQPSRLDQKITEAAKSKEEEIESNDKEESDEDKIELFDISDEIVNRLKKLSKVKYIHNSIVCKISVDQEIVSLTLVVDNDSTQEEIFDVKQKAKKLLNQLGFIRSIVEVEYEAEYKGLI
jgi:Co/Zn/Cd efflux system component